MSDAYERYVVLNDYETFSPLDRSTIVFVDWEEDSDWRDIQEAPVTAVIDIKDLLDWAMEHGYKEVLVDGNT